jgi:probable HAF family extracellular repeat protein
MNNIGQYYSFPQGVSGDGNVVTGFETGSAGLYRAFRWKNNVFEYNIAGNFSSGSDLSYDGKYLVGDGSGGAFMISDGNIEFFNQKYSDLLSPGSEFYTAFAVSSNGRYVVGIGKNGLTNQDEAYFLDTGGIKTSIKDNAEKINTFSLYQNYPNPFNPVTRIRYEVPTSVHVTIIIYNIVGQKIATLVDEYKSSGRYEQTWNAAGLSSGIYFYRIQAGSSVTTKKMILMK